MAKRRSPYEIDSAGSSSALHQKTCATGSNKSKNKKSKAKQPTPVTDADRTLFSSSHAEPLSGNNSIGSAELVLTDAERELMAAVDAKLAALAAPPSRRATSPTQQRAFAALRHSAMAPEHSSVPQEQQAPLPLSIEALEQKRVLLPYLDKIEYINCQLHMRGLLSTDQRSPGVPLESASRHCADSSVTPVAVVDNPPQGPKAPLNKPLRHAPAVAAATHVSGNQSLPATASPCNQDDAPSAAAAPSRALASSSPPTRPALSIELLRARYPRLVETIADPKRLAPRVRPITWLLKLIEDVYDALTDAALPSRVTRDEPPESLAPAPQSPRPESLALTDPTAAALGPPSPRGGASIKRSTATATAGALALPLFTRRFVHHALGLAALADQDCLDLVYNLERAHEQFAAAALFSAFLRELHDADALRFFLAVRAAAQQTLALELRTKAKLARTSSAKAYVQSGLCATVAHPLVPDGTQQVRVTARGCAHVLCQVFADAQALRRAMRRTTGAVPAPAVLAHFVATEHLAALFAAHGALAPLDDALVELVALFQAVSDDIVAQFKYNDDGASLTNLLRLRDTIACDAQIAALVAQASAQERALRTMKLELMRLERGSSADSRVHAPLRLLANRVRLQEQELASTQREIVATETRVNDVWTQVVAPPHTKRSKALPADAATAALASVLGRFECFVARLQRRHDLEAQAASVLATPWQQQLDALLLRMVVRIQRAYRARRQARATRAQARETLRDELRARERRVQRAEMERRRLDAVRDKDLARHHARLHAKQREEELARTQRAAKQDALLQKLRDEEIAQRAAKRARQHQAHAFAAWRAFVARRRKTRRAHRLALAFRLRQWRRHFAAAQLRVRAAVRIQRLVRRRRARTALRRVLNQRIKRSRVAAKYLRRVQHRRVSALFRHWCRFTAHAQTLRANLERALVTRLSGWFRQWVALAERVRAAKIASAVLIQRVYRGRMARHVLRHQRARHRSAVAIQRVVRGCQCRVRVRLLVQRRAQQRLGGAALRRRIERRAVRACYARLRRHAAEERAIKRMAHRRRVAAHARVWQSWAALVAHRRAKRAAWLRHAHESAVCIQRTYRRHRCQVAFRETIRRHRAAIAIQRVVRGHEGRTRAQRRWWERRAAVLLQAAWRKRRAQALVRAMRTEKILLGAFKGDYSSMKRSIAAGYGHVVDREGNGVVHMAAAAGHKRLVKLCLRSRLDVNASNRRGQTPLHLLLANLPPPPLLADRDHARDDTAVDVERERVDKVALAAYMIDHGAWPEAADEDGFTPLLLSAVLGQTDAVEMLLEREASTDARASSSGLNAAQLATEGNHWRTLHALLASRGFDYDQHGHDTVRLLHACAGRGLIDCLRVLIAHMQQRFDLFPPNVLDSRDDDGYTPLIYALANGYVDIVQCLLERNAGPDEKDFFGRSPLHFAVAFDDAARSEAMVQLLTLYEADVNVKDNDGDAPLHLCCDRDARLACSTLLLAHGAVICANALGNHATHIAARHGAVETLKLLVQYGGDMNLKNYEGRTPLGMARMYDQRAVVQHIAHYFAQEALADDGSDSGVAESTAAEECAVQSGEDAELGSDTGDQIATDDHDEQDSAQTSSVRVDEATDWARVLERSVWMGTIAEWTQFIDTATNAPFYSCESAEGSNEPPGCTWDPPPEFEAALGEDWEIVRATPTRDRTSSSPGVLTTSPSSRMEIAATTATIAPLVQYVYRHRRTDEVRTSVPPVDYTLLQDVVQSSKRQKLLRARIHRVAAADTSASAMEYLRFKHTFEAESAQVRAEIRAAVTIQRHYRARQTFRKLHALLHENRCALHLQRAFRGRRARRLAAFKRSEHAAATHIQAAWRGFAARVREATSLHVQRVTHLHRRLAARTIQRVFRGFLGRRAAYRELVVQKLGPHGYFAWEALRQRAVVLRSFQVWDELHAPSDFPHVRFYCHRVTRACSWTQPPAWVANDKVQVAERTQLYVWGYSQRMQRAAVQLQRHWRARSARVAFALLLRAVRLMQTCEQAYLEDPTSLVKMGNYVLYLHTITHDYARARPLYGRLMRTMAQRGPDVPFVLLSYGLFLYVTQEEDVGVVEEMIARGKACDPTLKTYKLAVLGFFRQAVVQTPQRAESNLNYAACLEWLYAQYDDATKYYVRAVAADPHKRGTMELFQEMLDRKRRADRLVAATTQHAVNTAVASVPLMSGTKQELRTPAPKQHARKDKANDDDQAQYDAFEVFRRWQAAQADAEDTKRRLAFQAQEDARARDAAARTLQARYRRRLAMRIANRRLREHQMGASIAALAAQKAVYDRVAAAFAAVRDNSSVERGAATQRPLSVPVARLSTILRGLRLELSDDDVETAAAQFRAGHPTLRHVNVLDLCQFVHANAALRSAMAASAPL